MSFTQLIEKHITNYSKPTQILACVAILFILIFLWIIIDSKQRQSTKISALDYVTRGSLYLSILGTYAIFIVFNLWVAIGVEVIFLIFKHFIIRRDVAMVYYYGLEGKSAAELNEMKVQNEKIDKEKYKTARKNKISIKLFAVRECVAIVLTAFATQLILIM